MSENFINVGEEMNGEIFFDENYKDKNNKYPIIKTNEKEIDWLTLGKELMVHEGFKIFIKIY